MQPDCPQTLVECPLCRTLHHGACNRRYFDRVAARDRFFRGRGIRSWLRMGVVHSPSAPQGRVTTQDVCDAAAPAVGTADITANPETAATTLPIAPMQYRDNPEQAISCAGREGNGKCGATNAMQTRLSRRPEGGSPGERHKSTSDGVASVTAGETATNLPYPTTPSAPETGSKVAEGASIL